VKLRAQVLTDGESPRSFWRSSIWGLGSGNDGVALRRIVIEP
jgi:hypothetical protein